MRCEKHPSYKALRAPRADCQKCREMYQIKLDTNNAMVQTAIAEAKGMNALFDKVKAEVGNTDDPDIAMNAILKVLMEKGNVK